MKTPENPRIAAMQRQLETAQQSVGYCITPGNEALISLKGPIPEARQELLRRAILSMVEQVIDPQGGSLFMSQQTFSRENTSNGIKAEVYREGDPNKTSLVDIGIEFTDVEMILTQGLPTEEGKRYQTLLSFGTGGTFALGIREAVDEDFDPETAPIPLERQHDPASSLLFYSGRKPLSEITEGEEAIFWSLFHLYNHKDSDNHEEERGSMPELWEKAKHSLLALINISSNQDFGDPQIFRFMDIPIFESASVASEETRTQLSLDIDNVIVLLRKYGNNLYGPTVRAQIENGAIIITEKEPGILSDNPELKNDTVVRVIISDISNPNIRLELMKESKGGDFPLVEIDEPLGTVDEDTATVALFYLNQILELQKQADTLHLKRLYSEASHNVHHAYSRAESKTKNQEPSSSRSPSLLENTINKDTIDYLQNTIQEALSQKKLPDLQITQKATALGHPTLTIHVDKNNHLIQLREKNPQFYTNNLLRSTYSGDITVTIGLSEGNATFYSLYATAENADILYPIFDEQQRKPINEMPENQKAIIALYASLANMLLS